MYVRVRSKFSTAARTVYQLPIEESCLLCFYEISCCIQLSLCLNFIRVFRWNTVNGSKRWWDNFIEYLCFSPTFVLLFCSRKFKFKLCLNAKGFLNINRIKTDKKPKIQLWTVYPIKCSNVCLYQSRKGVPYN